MSHRMIYIPTATRLRIYRYLAIGACLLLLTPVSSSRSRDSNSKPVKVLIVDGFSNHNWQQTTHVVRQILEPTGMFNIDVSTTPATPDAPRRDTVVKRLNSHPINDGYPERWKTPSLEVYTYARGPARNLTVLSYAYDETTEKYWPIEWIVQYGKGRVYNSTFGHLWRGEVEPVGVRCIGFQTTLIRATEWLATEKVKWPVPSNFPTESTLRLR